MLKNQARTLGLIVIAVSGITIASCSKDEKPDKVYRSKEYILNDKVEGGVAAGKVIVQETSDTSFRLTMRLDKSVKDTTYTFAIFKGNKTATDLDTAFFSANIKSQTTAAPVEAKADKIWSIEIGEDETQKFNYDSLLKYAAFGRISYVNQEDVDNPVHKVVAIGNIGKSAQ